MKESEKVGNKFYIWFLAILFIASLAFNVFLMQKDNKGEIAIDKLGKKNAEIVQKLKTAKNELNKYRGVSVKMDEIIKEANIKLEEKEKKIRSILSDSAFSGAESSVNSLFLTRKTFLGTLYLLAIMQAIKLTSSLLVTATSMSALFMPASSRT